jgi:hypothetical protein
MTKIINKLFDRFKEPSLWSDEPSNQRWSIGPIKLEYKPSIGLTWWIGKGWSLTLGRRPGFKALIPVWVPVLLPVRLRIFRRDGVTVTLRLRRPYLTRWMLCVGTWAYDGGGTLAKGPEFYRRVLLTWWRVTHRPQIDYYTKPWYGYGADGLELLFRDREARKASNAPFKNDPGVDYPRVERIRQYPWGSTPPRGFPLRLGVLDGFRDWHQAKYY